MKPSRKLAVLFGGVALSAAVVAPGAPVMGGRPDAETVSTVASAAGRSEHDGTALLARGFRSRIQKHPENSGSNDLSTATSVGQEAVPESPWEPTLSSWIPINPHVLGHRLSFQGRQAQVVAFQKSPTASTSVSLSFSDSIVDEPVGNSRLNQDLDLKEAPAPYQLPAGSISGFRTVGWGLSYEQQLVRTKCGWLAFDQLQKAMLADIQESP